MARSAVRVRPAVPADLPALVELAAGLREALLPTDTGARPGSRSGRAALAARLEEAVCAPDRDVVVAVGDDDRPLGMAVLTVASANALFDSPAVHLSHALVDDDHRRRGAGRALVAAAAAYAEEHGLEQVVVSARPGSREANRFFARLGFAPLATRRAASVATVRRRLARGDAPTAGLVRRRGRGGGGLAVTVPAQGPLPGGGSPGAAADRPPEPVLDTSRRPGHAG